MILELFIQLAFDDFEKLHIYLINTYLTKKLTLTPETVELCKLF